MTRAINANAPGWRMWFDLDGRLVERIYDPEHRCCGPLPDNAWVHWSRRWADQRATEREVQVELTAITDALTVEQHPGAARRLASQLVALRSFDRPDRPQLALADELAILAAVDREQEDRPDELDILIAAGGR
ncbi:hypothetical protein Lesp01_85120 [Lentzea sp. NBRC 102530]|nr:hypothetical protein Lesp01_85120 [Lentzea sp. NBRC 102530]